MEINVTIFDIINLFFCYSDVNIFNNYKIGFLLLVSMNEYIFFSAKLSASVHSNEETENRNN